LSRLAIFSSYTFLIFSICSLTGVDTTIAYVLGIGVGMALGGETQSKSEGEDGMRGEERGNGSFQSAFNNSSQIQTFFLHVKQKLLVSNLYMQLC
jgi:hypothetical protein